MSEAEKIPTPISVVKDVPKLTFEEDDKLYRIDFAKRLTKAITIFYPFYDEAYVLSLNARFGSGKTTFLNMWKTFLEKGGEIPEEGSYKVIYINAWETDFDDEPLIPIASSLLKQVGGETGTDKAKKALQGLLGASALISNTFLKTATGGLVDAKEIMEAVESDLSEDDLEKIGKRISEAFFDKKKLYEDLKASMEEYISGLTRKPLIVMVDELDRVRPDYAVKFLEAIKHIFSIQGVCFVLAVDRKQLEASVKQLYGDIDFDNYYLRFVTREVDLPEAHNAELIDFIEHVTNKFFDDKSARGISFIFKDKQKENIKQYAKDICKIFELKPRQIEHLFRVYSQFMAVDPGNNKYMDSRLLASFFLIATSISGHREIYQRAGKGELIPKDFWEWIKTLNFIDDRRRKHFFQYMLPFLLTEERYLSDAIALCKELEIFATGADDAGIKDSFGRTVDSWGRLPRVSVCENIYENLEEWKNFLGT